MPTTKTPHQWTQEDLETLRMEYGPGGKTQREVAAQLGLSPSQVSRQVGRMGLQKRPSGMHWTQEEEQTLLELAEKKSAPEIARIMQRRLHGVTGQLRKLNVSRRNRNGWYTLKEVAEILGMTLMLARQFVEDGRLKATYHNGRKPGRAGGGAWHIEERDLRRFLRRHPHELQGRNVDMVQLVQILAGIEVTEQERSKGKKGNAVPQAATGMRTTDGATGFRMRQGEGEEPDTLVMLRQERDYPGMTRETASIDADQLAELLESQAKGNDRGRRAG